MLVLLVCVCFGDVVAMVVTIALVCDFVALFVIGVSVVLGVAVRVIVLVSLK